MRPPDRTEEWIALLEEPLPVSEATAWAARPDCGAVVAFTGLVRDHSSGRRGVVLLEYEAYEGQAEKQMRKIVEEMRGRWPELGRVAVLHRVGALSVGEVAVVVVVSAAHRGTGFESASWCIDTVKSSVPIWKRETWEDGSAWAGDAREIIEVGK